MVVHPLPSDLDAKHLHVSVPSNPPTYIDDDTLEAVVFQRLHPCLYLEQSIDKQMNIVGSYSP
jgi:hypothetical protein